jgi:hypothetical protein
MPSIPSTEGLLHDRAARVDVATFRRILKRVPRRPVAEAGDQIDGK